ncbi:DNA-cytosine methyltransferase [Anaeromyxobacter sp. K]|uniref:DNA (cytosine-5-)-methyltransferase n=1 Tax=Anaeromyxobacter sp. (strain K) TaxID=447217 RepID=UPI00015F8967|nr:DNA (cytosine-5-)-methyltransferase [Anaeromyxobacter sp. K]ACG75155.1 DNA-cytosine methyltransferase [Anaeromyxobacter sp. K]
MGRVLDAKLPCPGIPCDATRESVREILDEGIAEVREIARALELLYGTPDLGNKPDPVDELVYIVLSRKTREDAYQATYDALKRRFASWEELLRAPEREVEAIVHRGGLGKRKTASLVGALQALVDRFGSCTLRPALQWKDEALEEFLCSLPEISRKSAYCIMMYSMGRSVFPVDTHVGRVLQRLGIYKGTGFSLEGLDHKQLQRTLADVVPPNLRRSLHINLVLHGREVCKAVAPACDACELRQLCSHYRDHEASRVEASDAPTVVDLFCGAGGLSEGFTRAGFRLVAAVDRDPVALKTLWLNHPSLGRERTISTDVRELAPARLKKLLGRRRLDVLVGAPPCQGFSTVGFRSKMARTGYRLLEDDRNFLFEYLVKIALYLRPRLFLMENVPGMQTARRDDLSFLDAAARMLERAGHYRTVTWQLNATTFGVPQDRTRCFLVASDGTLPIAPAGEYQDLRRPNFDVDALPPITLDEALLGIPRMRAGTGTAVERWDEATRISADKRHRRYMAKFGLLSRSPLIYNHFARYNNERDLELYALLRPGEDSVHALERHGRSDLMRYRRDVFDDKYARLRGDRPCKTIVSHLAKDGNGYIHPRETRNITVREAARVQSFRDDYVFCGSPTDQWIQVGNAVPPLMSEAIAKTFLRVLEDDER